MPETNIKRNLREMGLPPLDEDNGTVELSIQKRDGAINCTVIPAYPADRVPKVGDLLTLPEKAGEMQGDWHVMEVKHLAVPREKKTIRAVLLLVERAHRTV